MALGANVVRWDVKLWNIGTQAIGLGGERKLGVQAWILVACLMFDLLALVVVMYELRELLLMVIWS